MNMKSSWKPDLRNSTEVLWSDVYWLNIGNIHVSHTGTGFDSMTPDDLKVHGEKLRGKSQRPGERICGCEASGAVQTASSWKCPDGGEHKDSAHASGAHFFLVLLWAMDPGKRSCPALCVQEDPARIAGASHWAIDAAQIQFCLGWMLNTPGKKELPLGKFLFTVHLCPGNTF